MTKGDYLSKLKLMSFVNIDLSFVNIYSWSPSLSCFKIKLL